MRTWLGCLLALLVLSACADLSTVGEGGQHLGPPLERFALEGRLSLRQGERSDHIHFEWQHAAGRDLVVFSTPLGQGLAELGREATGAWLRVPGQVEQRAPDLSALSQKLFGSALPLEILAEWMGGSRSETHGEADGWIIAVTESALFRDRRLPRRIEVRRDDIELRIVVTAWGDND